MEFHNLAHLIGHVTRVAAEVNLALHEGLELATEHLLKETKATAGSYQSGAGPFASWAPLAKATISDRLARGFSANDPLLRSGELRDSYYKQVEGLTGGVGSDLDKALGMEVGDPIKGVPARSMLGLTFARIEKKVFEESGLGVEALLRTGAISKLYSTMVTR